MENDVRDYKQLVESFSYQSLPAEDRTVIEGHMHTLQAQLAEKSEEMKKALTQLAEAQYWTTYGDSSSTAPQVAGQEITKHVQGLKVSVSQLQSLFTTVGTHWESVAKSLQSNRLSNIGNHAMDTSGAPQGVGQSNALIAEVIVPKELEKIRNTIASFDVRLKAVENAAAESSEVVVEQIDALVAENVQALMLAATGSVQASPPPPRPANALTAQQRKMLETLQQNASVTQQHVQRLSQKVTEMATENEQLQGENAQLHAENVQLRQQLSEVRRLELCVVVAYLVSSVDVHPTTCGQRFCQTGSDAVGNARPQRRRGRLSCSTPGFKSYLALRGYTGRTGRRVTPESNRPGITRPTRPNTRNASYSANPIPQGTIFQCVVHSSIGRRYPRTIGENPEPRKYTNGLGLARQWK